MPAERVTQPVPGPAAFSQETRSALLSQAAILVVLGWYLRGDDLALLARARGARFDIEPIPAPDLKEFPVPVVRATGERFRPEAIRSHLEELFYKGVLKDLGVPERAGRRQEILRTLAQRLFENRSPLAAAELLEASLHHPSLLIRVAAASAYLELSTEGIRLFDVLALGVRAPETESDPLIRDLAATALGRFAPEHSILVDLVRGKAPPGPPRASQSSLLVHGTFARNASWWQPGGDFHSYFAHVRPDVYAGDDRFEWSGSVSNYARFVGARDLAAWVVSRGWAAPTLLGHSHGATLCMLATQLGLDVSTLVLLSCPVYVPEYLPDFTRIRVKAVSIRVRMDMTLVLAAAGQLFPAQLPIQENRLPLWFEHEATHDADVWKQHNIPGMI